MMEVVAIVELKYYIASICNISIITCKFSQWYELSSSVLFIIDKSFEINLYYTVLPFSLFINLRINSH